MELKIYSPAENEFLQTINFNNEELKKELTESLKKYEGLVYSEDSIKSAKVDRATLNKFKEAIEAKRIEIKKQCLKPYDDFEKKVKEITTLVDKPILAIDGQVKAFEDKQKQEKKATITDFYNANIGDLAELLPLSRIWNEKWLNATVKVKDVQTEITGAIAKVKADLEVITGLKSEFELQIKDTYLKTLDLTAALAEKTRLEDQKAKMEEYNRIQAERAQAQKEKELEQVANRPLIEPKTVVHEVTEEVTPVASEELQITQLDFRVWATQEQLAALKSFLLANGIKYGKVV